ncbi:MAG: hypothetical protein JSS63_13560 [Bacteroidetes bacterium]|nr:hypothetical protein [Bacteroidota bacterium]MBX7046096.1 hypothetical protein [Ignavibacteria bacterium]
MSKSLIESQVYPGWELPKTEAAAEEKALLINSSRHGAAFFCVKISAVIGLLYTAYYLFDKYNIKEEQFNLSEALTLTAFCVFAFGLAGFFIGSILSKVRR